MMTAETIARHLGGRKVGAVWMARCPAHDDRNPSLAIADARSGKVLVRCHAGCDQRDVISALQARGAWKSTGQGAGGSCPRAGHQPPAEPDRDTMNRTEAALAILSASQAPEATLVETYLRSRGIVTPLPPSIRFHPGLRHRSGGIWPAMVAMVTTGVDRTPIAIHRTFLARDGNGKAPVEPAKMMLAPCRGGAVRLADAAGVLMIGEGIETCLAAMQATGYPTWAALSTSGLRALDLPGSVREVIVLADGDDPGEKAARDAALRWSRQGRRVRIARPPRGMDFNDMLPRHTFCIGMAFNE
jgi:putative DNA primase/helicase